MDFFEHQERARRYTALMVVLFLLSVAAIVAVLNLVGVAIFAWLSDTDLLPLSRLLAATPPPVYWITTGVTLGIIGFGTLSRLYALSGGGAAVAAMLGARRVKRDSREPLERRLINVLEEMALASGISVPQAYVLDAERSINALAAGYSPNEAAVVVTRGALEELSRDELQGVMGHEFSHVLNGDMRLNIRLMGVVAGIVMIGGLGRFLMDCSSGRRRGDKGGDGRLFLVGLAIWIVGSIGVFFGSLIKAAVSRQREFLADASSVQFTRNPGGIAGALYKIGERGSVIGQASAEEISHMCIGTPVFNFADFELFSTHPPIEDRIERMIGPRGVLLVRDRVRRAEKARLEAQAAAAAGAPAPGEALDAIPFTSALADGAPAGAAHAWGRSASELVNTTPQALMQSIGTSSTGHVELARTILAAIPAQMRAAAESADAKAVLCALVLGEGETRSLQAAQVRVQAGEPTALAAEQYARALKDLDPRVRVPLLELALASLKGLPLPEREAVLALAKDLVRADNRVTLAEFVLLTLCNRHLSHEPKGAPPVKHSSPATLAAEAAVVLSLLAHAGRGGKGAFERGMAALGVAGELTAAQDLRFAAVEAALYELKLLAPLKKPLVIKACLETVMADGKLTVAEGELMRALCAALDSPLPPILETIEPCA